MLSIALGEGAGPTSWIVPKASFRSRVVLYVFMKAGRGLHRVFFSYAHLNRTYERLSRYQAISSTVKPLVKFGIGTQRASNGTKNIFLS